MLFSPDPASLEHSIRKEARSSLIDNNTLSSLDSHQPPSTQALVPSTDTRSPPSTDTRSPPSTDILHPTSIDTSIRTSIDTELRDMVATLILVRDERGDLYDHEGHLRNASGERREATRRRFRTREPDEFQQITLVSIDAKPRTSVDRSHPKPIDILSWTSIDNTYGVNRILQCREDHDSQGVRSKTSTSAQPCLPSIDRRAPITYRVYKPKIDVARLNALTPKPKPSENPPEAVRTPSDDGVDLWKLIGETRETEEDIRRMFCEAREHMRMRVTLKKKSDPGQFAVPCTVKGIEFPHALCDTRASLSILPRIMADHLGLQVEPSKELFTFVYCFQINSGGIFRDLEVQIGNALVPVDFHILDISLNWNSSLLLGRTFLSTVGAVCNLQTNRLCLTLIYTHFHYNPIPVNKPQTASRRINDPGIIVACHCGVDWPYDHHHESYAVKTAYCDQGADELHESSPGRGKGPRPEGRNPEPGGRNPKPGGRNLEAGSWSNLFIEYFSPIEHITYNAKYCLRSLHAHSQAGSILRIMHSTARGAYALTIRQGS
ncbi:hypothetical protein DY000_02020585 [Brassica cretica]|uniref:Aspartic peptidase DDI1-type domain-containing protein n=1 Tax=Brassica cretica TaxID=69181 RepID=A0ABQ7EA11_BRACR|nr:hypothetical protein DY000_02020585 [Brassica cretica]